MNFNYEELKNVSDLGKYMDYFALPEGGCEN